MDYTAISPFLAELMDAVEPRLRVIDEGGWAQRSAPGKWSRLEILGHLIDSAVNNHQRFVRAMAHGPLEWPGYAQDDHVRVQRFAQADATVLIAAFASMNRLIAFVLAGVSGDALETRCTIAGASAMTFRDLALDYVAHLEHHLRQILGGQAGEIPVSGMPWPPADPNRQWPV